MTCERRAAGCPPGCGCPGVGVLCEWPCPDCGSGCNMPVDHVWPPPNWHTYRCHHHTKKGTEASKQGGLNWRDREKWTERKFSKMELRRIREGL